MQPKFTFPLPKKYLGLPRTFIVIGELYSLDAVAKPIPAGIILTRGSLMGSPVKRRLLQMRRILVTRKILTKRGSYATLIEWVLLNDLLNPSIAKPEAGEIIRKARIEKAVRNIRSFAPRALPEEE